MSHEENALSDNETDEQFKYVVRGHYGDTWRNDRSGVRTIVTLLVALAIYITCLKTAQFFEASHGVQSSASSHELVTVMAYIYSFTLVATAIAAVVCLLIIGMCTALWLESDLGPNGVKAVILAAICLCVVITLTTLLIRQFYSI
jgi:hypothetical protein